ncbi:hypothetical protein [Streptomyces sp. DH8]|uniref:hypothetical protein n=1 Tax=Streptomyces sp. DH8 TaxID=2857008 RepID=UPI001E2BE3E1|nr:hypothetical protein [Streptomyces sp. DH8]
MEPGGATLTALHLFLVWATTALVGPALGFALMGAAWGGGTGAAVPVLAVGAALMVGLLALAGLPARTVVPWCGSGARRLGWAALVFVLGTLGVLAGVAAHGEGVGLGSAGTRFALVGAAYALAAAFFVPSRGVRLGALAVLVGGVVHGGFVGPDQAEQRRHEAETARYRERAELLYLGDAPPGMEVTRAEVGPASFGVEYHPVREGHWSGYVGLVVRSPLTPAFRCPEPPAEDRTCTADEHGGTVTVHELPGGVREVTLTRRHRNVQVEVVSQVLGQPGLRRLLGTLHPLSDAELEELMREKKIYHRS